MSKVNGESRKVSSDLLHCEVLSPTPIKEYFFRPEVPKHILCPNCAFYAEPIGSNGTNLCKSCLRIWPMENTYEWNFGIKSVQASAAFFGKQELAVPGELCILIPDNVNVDNSNDTINNKDERMGIRVDGSAPTLLNELFVGITGQTAISLLGNFLNGISNLPPALHYVVAANAVGFIGTLAAILLREKKPQAAGVLAKVGAIAAASATIVAMGMFLPVNFLWTGGVACVVSVVAVALS